MGNVDDLNRPVVPDISVDVTGVMEKKTEMLSLHKSQKEWLDRSQGMDSYLNSMKALIREVGEMSGRFEYAEGWRRHSPMGFCSADADPLAEALSDCSLVMKDPV
jgi:LmbE family N-acetylglucosaminyl deacetylase